MAYGISSETSFSMHLISSNDLKAGNPFFSMFKKLIVLLSESTVEFPEIVREIHNVQQDLKRTVQRRKGKIEKERCRVMHEMKNTLTGILSCAHVLNSDTLAYEDRQEFMSLIGREIDRIVGMAENFSEHCDERAEPLEIQRLSVGELFATIIPVIETHTLAGRNITLQVDADYTGEIQIDVEKVQQAFMNIVYNARDAMPDGGALTIRSRLFDNETVLFEFIDSGCGMSPEMQERIFEPFVTEGKPLGTGLGMAIVKEVIDEHQGTVEIESVLEEGTTVRIWLPIYQ